MTLAGDIVYNHDAIADEKRGELTEILCDALEAALGPETTTRLSNGQVADTLFHCLDLLVVSDEQQARLRRFLDEVEND